MAPGKWASWGAFVQSADCVCMCGKVIIHPLCCTSLRFKDTSRFDHHLTNAISLANRHKPHGITSLMGMSSWPI